MILLIKTWLELLAMKTKKIPMLIEGLLPAGQLGILVGPSDTGKSTLIRQLVQQLCSSITAIFGRQVFGTSFRILFLATEDDEFTTAFFLDRNSAKISNANDNLSFVFGADKDTFSKIKKMVATQKHDLVVVDNMADVFAAMGGTSLNDATQVRKFLGEWNSLCLEYGTTVVMVHHLRKDRENEPPTKNNLNGSQAIEAKARFVWELRGDPDKQKLNTVHLCITKGNSIPQDEKLTSIELIRDENLFFESTGNRVPFEDLTSAVPQNNAVKSKVLSLRADKKSFREIESELKINRGTISRIINNK